MMSVFNAIVILPFELFETGNAARADDGPINRRWSGGSFPAACTLPRRETGQCRS